MSFPLSKSRDSIPHVNTRRSCYTDYNNYPLTPLEHHHLHPLPYQSHNQDYDQDEQQPTMTATATANSHSHPWVTDEDTLGYGISNTHLIANANANRILGSRTRPKSRSKSKSKSKSTMTRRVARPFIVIGTLVVAAWATYSFATNIKIISDQKDWPEAEFFDYYIASAIMYFVILVLQLFGAFATAMPRRTVLWIYLWLSILSGLTMTATTVLSMVMYFAREDDIIRECLSIKSGAGLSYFSSWNPWSVSDIPTEPAQAQEYCHVWYKRALWLRVTVPLIIWFLCYLFVILSNIYYRRIRDESIVDKLKRGSSLAAGGGHQAGYLGHYIPTSKQGQLKGYGRRASDW